MIDELALKAADRESPVKAEFKGAIDDLPVVLEGSVGPIATFNDLGTPYPVRLKGEVADRKTALAFDMKRDDKGVVRNAVLVLHGGHESLVQVLVMVNHNDHLLRLECLGVDGVYDVHQQLPALLRVGADDHGGRGPEIEVEHLRLLSPR